MMKKKQLSQVKKDKILIFCLAVIAVALLLFCVKAGENPSDGDAASTTTAAPVTTTAAPQTTTAAPQTTTKAAQQTAAITQPVSQTETEAPVADEAAEALRVVTESMALIKSPEASFTGHKVQNIDIKLIDSSMPSMNDFVNGIIKLFVKQEVYDYDFTNGVAQDPENGGTSTSDATFPPGDLAFSLKREGVASGEIRKEGENTVYSVVLVPEKSTLENPRPPHHNSAADTLDLSTVNIPVAKITAADFEYAGATIEITLDSQGKIVGYYEHLPIKGRGEAEALGLSGYGTIEGYLEEKWDIKWK